MPELVKEIASVKATYVALLEAVAHWNRLATNTTAENEYIGTSHCSLCSLFLYTNESQRCVGCPVATKTKKTMCRGTPYDLAQSVWSELRFKAGQGMEVADPAKSKTDLRFLVAAKRELSFLQQLSIEYYDQHAEELKSHGHERPKYE